MTTKSKTNPLMETKEVRIALAEQHKRTRYASIEEVNNAIQILTKKHEDGTLNFIEVIKELESVNRMIMYLNQY